MRFSSFILSGLFVSVFLNISTDGHAQNNTQQNNTQNEEQAQSNPSEDVSADREAFDLDEEELYQDDLAEDNADPEIIEPPKTPEELQAEAQAAREEAELRIEAEMVNMTSLLDALAKNLGQMHYLRTLCFGAADQKWRNYASQMMALESLTKEDNKRRLVRAFNAGYYQEKERHTECTRNVSVDVAALAENGRHLASMLGDPYRDY